MCVCTDYLVANVILATILDLLPLVAFEKVFITGAGFISKPRINNSTFEFCYMISDSHIFTVAVTSTNQLVCLGSGIQNPPFHFCSHAVKI